MEPHVPHDQYYEALISALQTVDSGSAEDAEERTKKWLKIVRYKVVVIIFG